MVMFHGRGSWYEGEGIPSGGSQAQLTSTRWSAGGFGYRDAARRCAHRTKSLEGVENKKRDNEMEAGTAWRFVGIRVSKKKWWLTLEGHILRIIVFWGQYWGSLFMGITQCFRVWGPYKVEVD